MAEPTFSSVPIDATDTTDAIEGAETISYEDALVVLDIGADARMCLR